MIAIISAMSVSAMMITISMLVVAMKNDQTDYMRSGNNWCEIDSVSLKHNGVTFGVP